MKPSTSKWIIRAIACLYFLRAALSVLKDIKQIYLHGWDGNQLLSLALLIPQLIICIYFGIALLRFNNTVRQIIIFFSAIGMGILVIQAALIIIQPVPVMSISLWMSVLTIQGRFSAILVCSLSLALAVLTFIFLRLKSTQALFQEDLTAAQPSAPEPNA